MKTLYVLSVTLFSLPDTFPHHRTVLFFYDILQFSRACWPCLLSLIHSYPAHLCSVWFCCKKSGYFTKPVKNITNRIFISHKQVNNDTKSNSYGLKRQ